ncbi:MAG: PH domain-containing protein [Candidatus Uhrbacteria bacterium]
MHITKRLNLRASEHVEAVLRRSVFVPIPSILLGAVVLVLAFLLIVPLFRFGLLGLLGFGVLVVLGAASIVRSLWLWYRTAFVVTNHRIFDIDQVSVLHRSVTEARFARIEDIVLEVRGVLASVLRCGTLRIQTERSDVEIEMTFVPHVEEAHELLNRLWRAYDRLGRGDEQLRMHELDDVALIRMRGRIDAEMARRGIDH